MTAACPGWCTSRHDKGVRLHLRDYPLDAYCCVTAAIGPHPDNGEHYAAVTVHQAGRASATLAPGEAMALALIIQERTHDARMRRMASAMYRAGELLLPLDAEPAGA